MSVVGIDFGTYTCFIAVARAGGIETVANEYSDRTTPTYVAFTGKQRIMGAAAKQQATTNVKNTFTGFKSMVGRKFKDPVVKAELPRLHYKVTEGPGGSPGIHVRYMEADQTFSPEQITAMMFTKLRMIAEVGLKTKVVDVVISVPCAFTDQQRRSMLEACHMAGLNCLRLMNDTLAVSLAYGIYKQDLPAENEKSRNVVFVDMGYTALQVSLCAFNKGKLKMLAVVTDPNLGGRDFDRALLEHFAKEFKTKYKIDVLSNAKATIRLTTEVEKVKKLMSANTQKIPLNIECLMNDMDIHTSIDRAKFEELSESLLTRLNKTLASLLHDIKFSLNDVHSVEIVGGSSRVPAVKTAVKNAYSVEASTTLNADEAVARGCALQCAILSPTFRVRDFSVTDCQLYPITLRWQGGLNEDSDLEICPKFHAVPFFKMLTYFRKDALTIDCKYTYPNDIPYPDSKIGSFRVNNIVPQANGESSKVKVKVSMNNHGIFSVSSASLIEKLPETETKEEPMNEEPAKVNGELETAASVEMGKSDTEQSSSNEDQSAASDNASPQSPPESENMQTETPTAENATSPPKKGDKTDDKKGSPKKKATTKSVDLPIEPFVPGLTRNELNNYIEKEGQMIMQDKLESERQYAKNAVEEYVYEMRDKLYAHLEQFITEKDRESFSKHLGEVEDWLYEDGEDVSKNVYQKKLESLKALGDPVVKRFEEARDRPAAFEAFGASLQRIRKVLELVSQKDEKYDHLTPEDISKVEICVKQKTEWFDKQLNLTTKLAPHANPAVLTSQIVSETQLMESTCNPIINKPKPKVEPPKEEKPADAPPPTDTTNNAQNEQKDETEPEQKEVPEQQGQGEGVQVDDTMEVD